MGTEPDYESMTAAHNNRMARIDPLIPPAPAPQLPGDGQVIAVDGAIATARVQRTDPDSLDACWGALTTYALQAIRIGGVRDAGAAMEDLLTSWQAWAAEAPADADDDTSAGLMWPSRDVEVVNALLDHGLSGRISVAARGAGRPVPGAPDIDAIIRPMEARDIDGAVERYLDVIEWDAQFGAVTARPSAPESVRADVAHALTSGVHSAWVAERDGAIAGLVIVEWPSPAGWFASLANAGSVAYLGTMSVASGRRGAGIGSALSRTAHDALDKAGVELTLLHHSIPNPLSTPFWHLNGYRPLWTGWSARPHSALR